MTPTKKPKPVGLDAGTIEWVMRMLRRKAARWRKYGFSTMAAGLEVARDYVRDEARAASPKPRGR